MPRTRRETISTAIQATTTANPRGINWGRLSPQPAIVPNFDLEHMQEEMEEMLASSAKKIKEKPKIDIKRTFAKYCKDQSINFEDFQSIKTYHFYSLFCDSAMQQYRGAFQNPPIGGMNIGINQLCMREKDINSVGDGITLPIFNMLSVLSFHDWTVRRAMAFWITFLEDILGLKVDKITVHPERDSWTNYVPKGIYTEVDRSCRSDRDRDLRAYSAKFFIKGIHVGSISNPQYGSNYEKASISSGFGLERLDLLVNNTKPKTRHQLLAEAASAIIKAGYKPGTESQELILRQILQVLWNEKADVKVRYLKTEGARIERNRYTYEKMKYRHPDKNPDWWFVTFGVELTPEQREEWRNLSRGIERARRISEEAFNRANATREGWVYSGPTIGGNDFYDDFEPTIINNDSIRSLSTAEINRLTEQRNEYNEFVTSNWNFRSQTARVEPDTIAVGNAPLQPSVITTFYDEETDELVVSDANTGRQERHTPNDQEREEIERVMNQETAVREAFDEGPQQPTAAPMERREDWPF